MAPLSSTLVAFVAAAATARACGDIISEGPYFEGDIVITREALEAEYGEAVAAAVDASRLWDPNAEAEAGSGRRLGASVGGRWPTSGGVAQVPYTFATGSGWWNPQEAFDVAEKSIIVEALDKLEARAGGIVRFFPRSGERDYVEFKTGTGCSSPVGRSGGRQSITLQNTGGSTGRGCLTTGVIQHEMLHSLGFWHEQSRPDRDSFVTINFANIQSGREFNFEKRRASDVNSFGSPYDYDSVMHYGATAFSRDLENGLVTIEAPRPIGQRDGISDEDVFQLRAMYDPRLNGNAAAGPVDSGAPSSDDQGAEDAAASVGAGPYLLGAAAATAFLAVGAASMYAVQRWRASALERSSENLETGGEHVSVVVSSNPKFVGSS